MPRPPDVMNLLAWLVAIWLATAAVMLGMTFWRPSVRYHWTTDVYLAATVLFSLIAFGAMFIDKYKAGSGGRRVPEVALHTLELLGGWPGSMLGQRTFRHKTRKITYQVVFWVIAAVHVALLAWTLFLWSRSPSQTPAPSAPAEAAEPAAM
jgi:uncharacterized membrane protein YsdA (DUF1294 family)